MATPGYRARRSFAGILATPDAGPTSQTQVISLVEGAITETGSPFDIALTGDGFFVLDGGVEGRLYTRNGQFTRDAEGRLIGTGGRALQASGGGDLITPDEAVAIKADGAVMAGDRQIGRIAVASIATSALSTDADGLFRAPDEAVRPLDAPVVRQGFLEASNVVLGDEMIGLMEAMRRAETGQRLMNLYDDLMGRAVTTFGQSNG